jgi:hypothetical protein
LAAVVFYFHYDEIGYRGLKLRHMTQLRPTVAVSALLQRPLPQSRRYQRGGYPLGVAAYDVPFTVETKSS